MYKEVLPDGNVRFAVESKARWTEVFLKDGEVVKASYGPQYNIAKDSLTNKQFAIATMFEISVECFVELAEHLNDTDRCYKFAMSLLEKAVDETKEKVQELSNQLERMDKILKRSAS